MKDPYISYFTDLPKEPTDFSRQQERELDMQVGADDITGMSTLNDLNCVTSVTINKMIKNFVKIAVNEDGVLVDVTSPEWAISRIVCELLKERHDDFTTEVVLADKRKIEIEEDNYYTFYYTREDLKDVDKYIEWIKSVV